MSDRLLEDVMKRVHAFEVLRAEKPEVIRMTTHRMRGITRELERIGAFHPGIGEDGLPKEPIFIMGIPVHVYDPIKVLDITD